MNHVRVGMGVGIRIGIVDLLGYGVGDMGGLEMH